MFPYKVSGSFDVQNVPEALDIADRLGFAAGNIKVDISLNEDDTLRIDIFGTQMMDMSGVDEVDSAILEFAPYVVNPADAYVLYKLDDEIGELRFDRD